MLSYISFSGLLASYTPHYFSSFKSLKSTISTTVNSAEGPLTYHHPLSHAPVPLPASPFILAVRIRIMILKRHDIDRHKPTAFYSSACPQVAKKQHHGSSPVMEQNLTLVFPASWSLKPSSIHLPSILPGDLIECQLLLANGLRSWKYALLPNSCILFKQDSALSNATTLWACPKKGLTEPYVSSSVRACSSFAQWSWLGVLPWFYTRCTYTSTRFRPLQ